MYGVKIFVPIGTIHREATLRIYGDVKVSTGDATLDKRAAVRNRHKIRKLKITDKRTVALAA